MRRQKRFPIMASALALSVTGSMTLAKGARPNIVILIADDIGFPDVGAFGSEIDTPAIDQLASGATR